MKIALEVAPMPQTAQFASQVGVRHAVIGGPDSPTGRVEYAELARIQELFAAYELEVCTVENVPTHFYDQVLFGLPGRDRQLDNYCATIEAIGRAGIPILGYNWMLLGGISTDQVRGRGGARLRRFDLEEALRNPAAALDWRRPHGGGAIRVPDRELSGEEVWDNLAYFLERVLPTAESCQVKLAAHPDDAPIPSFMGVARILNSTEALQRVIDLVPSPCNGLDLCQGTVAEMEGTDPIDAIRHFGRQQKLFFAHFRAVQGQLPGIFHEVFMDEGDWDMVAAVKEYQKVGFDGPIRADHTPWVVEDNEWGHRGFAFQIGYMRGLIQALEEMG